MRLLFHAAVAASSPPWPEIHIDRGRRTETDLDSGIVLSGDVLAAAFIHCVDAVPDRSPSLAAICLLPSPPLPMRGCVRASIHPSRTPDVHPAEYLMRVHRDRRDPIVLCDVGTPGLSAPLGDDRQVRLAAC
ncbi:uncharacterized protein CCOS01_02361 [Colletotrichum costaricense]|uniref:Uncharacterized protein n=1 Tax=Colletotrichum costaricense TaxID=1209916 RepID=A0AAJ0E721_9PEZI|nr:uncharacterized protein CCOS01_02361 [Colletotrichum costaricense]KAK1537041.1 hypothetical protein CCOS01_02361 [Colletotrichum costaricense]